MQSAAASKPAGKLDEGERADAAPPALPAVAPSSPPLELTGWGRYPRGVTRTVTLTAPGEAAALLRRESGVVLRGNGRSYGDAAIGERVTGLMSRANRLVGFDEAAGLLTVEAGALLSDILRLFVPRGFFPMVVPGTQFVTVGGMIAADVHGKNHHRDGGMGEALVRMTVALPGGRVVGCSCEEEPELFAATVGGMGLTGAILTATFRMRRIETGWIRQATAVAPDLSAALQALRRSGSSTYSVAWIDCLARGKALGRSLVYAGEHASLDDLASLGSPGMPRFPPPRSRRLTVPVELPGFTLNRLSVAAFNELYYRRGAARADTPFLTSWESYFFPLDGVRQWNRIYGRRGFLQHQCVIPPEAAEAALSEILEIFARSGSASFLAVLKQLGSGSGLISFPREGYTLALDLPVGPGVLALLEDVDRIVRRAGGRLYLAKDARQSRETFEAGYDGLPGFRALRRSVRADTVLRSHMSARLGL